MKEITKEWIGKAEGDWKTALKEFNSSDPVYDNVCFHAHQCVEKYLKAILVENLVYFEKIHDLEILGEQVKNFLPEILNKREDLIWLTQYSVRVRYPGFNATEKDSIKTIEIAKEIRKIIRNYFKMEVEDEDD